MAGARIIEGDIDAVPDIAVARERVFVFQPNPYGKMDNPIVKEDNGHILPPEDLGMMDVVEKEASIHHH